MKTNKRLVLVVGILLVTAVAAYLILGAVNTKNNMLKSARSHNDLALNEMHSSSFEPVASSKQENCNREASVVTLNCEVVESRGYVVEDAVNAESVITARRKITVGLAILTLHQINILHQTSQ